MITHTLEISEGIRPVLHFRTPTALRLFPSSRLRPRALCMATVLMLGAFRVLPLTAQQPGPVKPPARRGTGAQIETAHRALEDAVAAVSRNPSAFVQEVSAGTGCSVGITTRRVDAADTVQQRWSADAGLMRSDMQMSMDDRGGIIVFTYRTVGGARAVSRERGRSPVPSDRVALLELLVAETSQQPAVRMLLTSWAELVRVCGGEVVAETRP